MFKYCAAIAIHWLILMMVVSVAGVSEASAGWAIAIAIVVAAGVSKAIEPLFEGEENRNDVE